MKQCPSCKATYADDSLQFCLNDGTNLISASNEAETMQMSFGNQPMRVNIPQNSAPTVFAQPIVNNQPAKKSFGLIVAGVLVGLLFLAIAGIGAMFFFLRQNDNKNSIVAASPTPTGKPVASPSAALNDETERLKEEMANLKKQLGEQKNQKSNTPNVPPLNQKGMTARANSPNDGFLALRSEPNSETGYRIAKIPHGATLTVIACPKSSNIGKMAGRWCQVIYDGQTGWAFDAFMIF